MADPRVIAICRDRIETFLALSGVPFRATLNVRSASVPIYVSLERDFSSVERVTLGVPSMFRETGSLTAIVAVQSGTGTSKGEILTEELRDLFHNFYSEHFRVETVDSYTVLESDDGNYFQLRVSIHYYFDFFK